MKKNKIVLYILFALAAGVLYSCESLNCVDGNGLLETEERVVREFYGVENSTSFDVEIISDSIFQVLVTADENLLPLIETTVRGGDLYIDVEERRCINSREHVTIEIYVPTLDKIVSTGSGDMSVDDLDCENINITNSGSGDIDIENIFCYGRPGDLGTVKVTLSGSGTVDIWGKTGVADYKLSGSGDILGEDLDAINCYVTSTGSGDVYCYASEFLDVDMSGSGDVIYYGSPRVRSDINGSGDLRHRNK